MSSNPTGSAEDSAPTLEAVDLGSTRPAHRDPEHVGAYRILEKMGEGGMGVVYKAEQKQPVRRLVALKVIKLGMDTREVIARFEAERQALALMNHPNVAKVYEAGATEHGRPYFAMEFVAGVPLVRYCDECRLTTRERLELFVQVCHAVQHAHQKGIIHRDLKPSNILVTHFDGKPAPKVIDFGIAKAANHALTELTLYTRTGSLIGTPEYMSPEQALTSGLDVDTRTDIYSLGVILYELLTGTLPLDPAALHRAGIEGMAQMIKTAEPPKPSTRLSMLGDGSRAADNGTRAAGGAGSRAAPSGLAEVASLRRCDAGSLQRELRGDLDWIVLTAMEKDRTRRYETANGLAMDVRRHLDDEPVLARPPTTAYRMSRFARRNRTAVIAAGVVVLAAVLGVTGVMVGFVRAGRARDAALVAEANETRQRHVAEQAIAQVNDTNQFMGTLLTAEGPDYIRQYQLGVRRLDGGWLRDDPQPQAELRLSLASTALRLGTRVVDLAEVNRQTDVLLQLTPALEQAKRGDILGATWFIKASVAESQKDTAAAERAYAEAIARLRPLHGRSRYLMDSLERLANLKRADGDVAGAAALRFESLQHQEQRFKDRSDTFVDGVKFRDWASLLIRLGKFQEALAPLDRAAQLEPESHWNWYFRGCLLAYLQRGEEYRTNCRSAADRFFSSTDPGVMDHVAKACLLLPESGVEPDRLRYVVQEVNKHLTGTLQVWAALLTAMERHRAGDAEGCLASVRLSRQIGGDDYPPRFIALGFLAAMSEQELGRTSVAQAEYQAAATLAFARLSHAGRTDVAEGANIEDWLIAHVLHREAGRRLGLGDAADAPHASPLASFDPATAPASR